MPTGAPPQLRDAMQRAPADERALLELRLEWPALDDARARIAARLRVFLLTWDPLGWHERPPVARATATGDGDGFEAVLYVPLHCLPQAAATEEEILAVLGDLAGSVLSVGAGYEQALSAGAYPQLAYRGKAPGLLSRVGTLSDLPAPAPVLVSGSWEPIGLGAIQDLVQEEFGPVDLDRSPVRLAPVDEPDAGCPACAGGQFGFPAELADAQQTMCPAHDEQAATLTDERLQRAWDSNHDGMDAILGSSELLGEPMFGLSLALLSRLEDLTRRDPTERLSPAELAADAELALALAEQLAGEPERVAALASFELLPPDWMIELPMALASGGLVDEAVAVGDAFAELDPDNAGMFAADVALILAQAGRSADARMRVEASLEGDTADVWAHIRAGAVHAELDDPARAEQELRTALVLARGAGDAEDVATVLGRLAELLAGQPGREDEAGEAEREAERWSDAAYGGTRIVVKVGRNDPCPCGSGRKHKRCCGAR